MTVQQCLYLNINRIVSVGIGVFVFRFDIFVYRHGIDGNTCLNTRAMVYIEFGSESFEEFLELLGEKIRLKGWERFRGGLDVKGM